MTAQLGPHSGRRIGDLDDQTSFRFWRLVDRPENGCWTWLGSTGENGRGVFRALGGHHASYRIAYALEYGEVPAGLVVRHTCDNKTCVRPAHLQLGTQSQNMADARGRRRHKRGIAHYNSSKTECYWGHALLPDNTYIDPRGWRSCRECRRLVGREQSRRTELSEEQRQARNAYMRDYLRRRRAATPRIKLANAEKTHCPHGHEYTEDNTIRERMGGRRCKTCHRNRNRALRIAKKSAR